MKRLAAVVAILSVSEERSPAFAAKRVSHAAMILVAGDLDERRMWDRGPRWSSRIPRLSQDYLSIDQQVLMNISDGSAQQAGRQRRRSFMARHLVAFAAAIAGGAALIVLVTGSAPRKAVPSAAAVAPAVSEQFQYFPDLYVNQAKRTEDPVPTF